MVSVVTRKIPRIVLVDKDVLSRSDVYRLTVLNDTEKSEFVICPHERETIYLNKALNYAEELIPIINKLMEQKYLNSKTDKIYQQFKNLAGEKAGGVLIGIWQDWRKERILADTKEEAEKALLRARKRHIRKNVKKKEEVIKQAFDIGFGLYDERTTADFQKGAESAFTYGYLCALEDMEKNCSI